MPLNSFLVCMEREKDRWPSGKPRLRSNHYGVIEKVILSALAQAFSFGSYKFTGK
jgi:hypothetical protein